MRYTINIFFLIILSLVLFPSDSSARLFAPSGNDYIGTHPEAFTDQDGDGKYDVGEPYVDYNHNGQWDSDTSPDITNMTWSATWDANFPLVVCLYDRTAQFDGSHGSAKLKINDFFVNDTSKVLFGINDAASCPLPGTRIFVDYPNAIAGEFLISGVICVVNTIIFDSMFKVYCTIILWFYNILYAMIIIYVMFYGLSIMLGIGNDPVREAPKRILKIVLIFFFAVNAQFGFRFIHNGFFSAMNGFSDMLTEVQPYFTDRGQPAYYKSFLSSLGAGLTLGLLDGPGKLLDENGSVWRPSFKGQNYYMDSTSNKALSMPGSVDMNGYLADDVKPYVTGENYVPFRMTAQQWSYEKSTGAKNENGTVSEYRIFPVFKEVDIDKQDVESGLIVCIFDVKWNPDSRVDPGDPNSPLGRLEYNPHCEKNHWPSMPEVAPYGMVCYQYNDPFVPAEGKCTEVKAPSLAPTRLENTDKNTTKTCETLTPTGVLTGLPLNCRKPFQGVLGKMDALINATLGDDSSKSLGALAIAILMWGTGAGFLLSLLLMTGIITLFVASFQLIWTYVTALMALTFLTMLSPIFVSCALFQITDKFFRGWLSAVISYAMQPFLIMAFLFVLSNMVTTDKLEKMAKREVGIKQMISKIGGSDNQMKTTGPAFLGPLYNKPSDFDSVYYSNKSQTSKADQIFINAEQRDIYIKNKGEWILNYWICAQSGVKLEDTYQRTIAQDCSGSGNPTLQASLVQLRKLWYEGVTDASGRLVKGIEAVAASSDPKYKDLLECYKNGCYGYPGLNSYEDVPEIATGQCPIHTVRDGGKCKYPKPIYWDDGDSYVGEPDLSIPKAGTIGVSPNGTIGPEYPVCLKYCPQFKPTYDPNKAALANPLVGVPADTKYPDGRVCPNGADNKPMMCAPNAECIGNCMGIKNAMSYNFSTLTTAILTWILLNAVTAAFFSKVPKIAESLSQWSSYAPRGMPLGGGSRAWDETGMDGWSREERSGFYHMGGLLDTGAMSGRPSGVFALMSAMGRISKGPRQVVNMKTGAIESQPRYYDPSNPYGWDKQDKQDRTSRDNIAKIRRDFFDIGENDKTTKLNDDRTKISIGKLASLSGGTNDSVTNALASMSHTWTNGLPQSKLWEIIQKSVGNSMTSDYTTIKNLIDKALKDQFGGK